MDHKLSLNTDHLKSRIKDIYRETFSEILSSFIINVPAFLVAILVITPVFYLMSQSISEALFFSIGSIVILAIPQTISGSFYFFNKMRKARKSKSNFRKINKILANKNRYLLYLTNFDQGKKTIYLSPPLSSRPYSILGNHRMIAIIKKLKRERIKVFFLYNYKDLNNQRKGYPLVVTNDIWYEYFMILADQATCSIIDYGNGYKNSENIRKELRYLGNLEKHKIIFCGREEELKEMIFLFPKIKTKIVSNFKLLEKYGYSDNGDNVNFKRINKRDYTFKIIEYLFYHDRKRT